MFYWNPDNDTPPKPAPEPEDDTPFITHSEGVFLLMVIIVCIFIAMLIRP